MGICEDVGICENCARTFRYRLIHNGFNDTCYAYCDTCGATSLLDVIGAPKDFLSTSYEAIAESAEAFVAPCECGGKFRRGAGPRCPHCKQPLSAKHAAKWIEGNAAGTKMGWRWQRDWTDLYCIIVEDKVVRNNWSASAENR